MKHADVVVVGAGVAGCATAAHLLRLDSSLKVVLVDRHHVGAGSTSRSTAAFRHQWSVPVHVAFSKYASAEYDRMAERGHPIGFRRNGYLFLYHDKTAFAEAAQRVEQQQKLGVSGVEVLVPEDIASRTPVSEHLDLAPLAGATWGPDDGFLDPLAVAQAYLTEAKADGADYRPGRTIIGITQDQGRLTGLTLDDGSAIGTSRVVNAAGVWSHAVAECAGLNLPIVPAKRYLYHSRPLRGLDVTGWPLVIAPGGAHARPSEGNTLMMAWEDEPAPYPVPPPEPRLWDEQDTIDAGFGAGDYGLTVLSALAEVIPALGEEVALARVTCGWYCVTPDHKAVLSQDPRLEGLFHATGFSGHGIMHGAATGLTMAELVLNHTTTLADPEDIERNFGLRPLLSHRLREPVESMVL